MLSSCTIRVVDDVDMTIVVVLAVVIVVIVLNVLDVIIELDASVDIIVVSSSVTLRHDAVIINAKMSRSRNGFGILDKNI
jgi:hypothetical protein